MLPRELQPTVHTGRRPHVEYGTPKRDTRVWRGQATKIEAKAPPNWGNFPVWATEPDWVPAVRGWSHRGGY